MFLLQLELLIFFSKFIMIFLNLESLVLFFKHLILKSHIIIFVKIDIATSCDDLIVESIEQGSSSKCKKVVESDNYDDYVKLYHHNPYPSMLDPLPSMLTSHYMLRKDSSGKMKVMFLGPPNKNRPKQIWVAKSLVEKVKGPHQVWVPKQ